MHRMIPTSENGSSYRGLRMAADAYLELADDGHRYELIDGVICMSPSPSFKHQRIITEIAFDIRRHISDSGNGAVVVEVDVKLADDLVYRPDLIYLCEEKAARCGDRVNVIPDVVVEVVSPDSGPMDRQTKRNDYERFSVGEYWLIDPIAKTFEFMRLRDGRFEGVDAASDAFESEAIPGFRLKLPPIRALFE